MSAPGGGGAPPAFLPARINQKKRDGFELSAAEIAFVVDGVKRGGFSDAQLGAFLMAVCKSGMTRAETATLTLQMRDSGHVMARLGDHPRVDKHSTGGVGDKTSLLLAPLLAAAGAHVPMISGRGLGHTGGTIDKLEAIAGYRTGLGLQEFAAVLADCGFAMAGAGPEIAPADGRMYATRDVTGTVESIPLITSSILSKKLAENLDGLVMDVKVGRAAFMTARADAERLLRSLVEVGAAAGLPVTALLTDMDHPLGQALGNALEIQEVARCCRGEGPPDLLELTLELGVEMALLAGLQRDAAAARARLLQLLQSGQVAVAWQRNIERQGGDPRIVEQPERLGTAPHVVPVLAARRGTVVDVDPKALGDAVVDLGGGRQQAGQAIDPLVGIVLAAERGTKVERETPLAFVHARTAAQVEQASRCVRAAMPVGDGPAARAELVQLRLRAATGTPPGSG